MKKSKAKLKCTIRSISWVPWVHVFGDVGFKVKVVYRSVLERMVVHNSQGVYGRGRTKIRCTSTDVATPLQDRK